MNAEQKTDGRMPPQSYPLEARVADKVGVPRNGFEHMADVQHCQEELGGTVPPPTSPAKAECGGSRKEGVRISLAVTPESRIQLQPRKGFEMFKKKTAHSRDPQFLPNLKDWVSLQCCYDTTSKSSFGV